MPRAGPARHTMRAVTALAGTRPAYAAGVRAAIATVVPLLLAHVLGTGGATWMSLGGFSGALADRGGAYRTRALTMTAVTLCCATAIPLATLASGHLALAIVLTFIVALATSLARVWGAAGVSVGGATLTAFVIALAFPPEARDGALVRAAFNALGGVWAMGIALVLWPLQPFRPARLAVGRSYRALAAHTADVALRLRGTPLMHTSELPAGSADVRVALEEARLALTRSRRGRPGASGREERLVVLGEIVDQLYGHVLAVAESVDSMHAVSRRARADDAVVTALDALTSSAHALAAAVESEGDAAAVTIGWSGEALRQTLSAPADRDDATSGVHYREAATLLDRAAQFARSASETVAALNGGRDAKLPTASTPPGAEGEDGGSPLAPLRDALSLDSLIFRYALRVAVVATVAVAIGELLELKRGYWLTITVIVILQPYTGLTTQRAVQRVVGTVLGGLLTAALGAMFHDPRAILVLSFVFAAVCVALLPVNYAAFSIFLTPTFVLLAEASAGDWNLAGTRVLNTLLGGALALGGSRLLWPSPETSRLPGYMAGALRANRRYLDRVAELFDERGEHASRLVRDARRRVGLATVNAEESFQRLLGESGADGRLSSALSFLTYTRRLSGSIAALALARYSETSADPTAIRPWIDSATRVLDDLASSAEEERAPAPLPPTVTEEASLAAQAGVSPLLQARLDRLARQLRLLHDAVTRWASADSRDADRNRA